MRFSRSFLTVPNLVVGGFFGLLLLLGLALHRDYGVSWDEPNNHLNGLVTIKYVAQLVWPGRAQQEAGYHLIPAIQQFRDADHGPIFEVPIALLGYLFTNGDSRQFYFLRHLAIFFVFVGGAWALYQLGEIWFDSWQLGLLTSLLLVLSPRFFAESFYNGKDIVYMALFTIAMYSLVRTIQRPTSGRVVLHGLATALAIDVRVQGLVLLAVTLILFLFSFPTNIALAGRRWKMAGLYAGATVLFVVAGWPYLWAMSLAELTGALSRMGRYPWPHTNFYLGHFWPATSLPWHYIPVWILITTPLPYVVAALGGIVVSSRRILRGKAARVPAGWLDVVVLLWLLGPVMITSAFHVVVYESWRHLYFVYPALLLLAVRGLQALGKLLYRRHYHRAAVALLVLFGLSLAHTAVRMVRLHPYENVYFSFLPAQAAERLFERDYWGLSFRQGLEWLMRYNPDSRLAIHVAWHYPLYNNSLILPPADRARIHYVPLRQAKYFITGYRWHPQSYADSVGREIYTIRAEGIKILSVFQRR